MGIMLIVLNIPPRAIACNVQSVSVDIHLCKMDNNDCNNNTSFNYKTIIMVMCEGTKYQLFDGRAHGCECCKVGRYCLNSFDKITSSFVHYYELISMNPKFFVDQIQNQSTFWLYDVEHVLLLSLKDGIFTKIGMILFGIIWLLVGLLLFLWIVKNRNEILYHRIRVQISNEITANI